MREVPIHVSIDESIDETTHSDSDAMRAAQQREIEALAAELTLDRSSLAYSRLSDCYRRAGLAADACRVAEVGLERHPQHVPGRVALGLALLDLGDLGRARAVLCNALTLLEEAAARAARRSAESFVEVETGAEVRAEARLEAQADVEAEADNSEEIAEDNAEDNAEDLAIEAAGTSGESSPHDTSDLAAAGALAAGSAAFGLAAAAFDGAPSHEEIDSAFEFAESQPEEMHDVVSVAHEAMRRENLDRPELPAEPIELRDIDALDQEQEPEEFVEAIDADAGSDGDDGSVLELDAADEPARDEEDAGRFAPDDHPAFATHTMAQLLAGQGDQASADAIRNHLLGAQGLQAELPSQVEIDIAEGIPEAGPTDAPSAAAELALAAAASVVDEAVAEEEAEEAEPMLEIEPLLDATPERPAEHWPDYEPPRLQPLAEEAPAPAGALDAAEVPREEIPAEELGGGGRRTRILSTLDTWLRNIRREIR